MKVLIDTNVILDYALIRHPFYDLADSIFALIEQKQIEGYVGASTFSDLFYILRKPRGNKWTLDFLRGLANLCQIVPVNSAIIEKALNKPYKDFEDDIQYHSAVSHNLDALVTRNSNDFLVDSIRILTPEQLLAELGNKNNE